MAKPQIVNIPRGHVPNDGWFFTSYRLPLDVAQKIDRIAQKESKDQGVTVSMNTVVVRALEMLAKEYGPVQGIKSELTASKNARKDYSTKPATAPKAAKSAVAQKAAAPAPVAKKAPAPKQATGKRPASSAIGKALAKKPAPKKVIEEEVDVA